MGQRADPVLQMTEIAVIPTGDVPSVGNEADDTPSSRSVSFASNDYLGLSRHPDVIAAANAAMAEYGVGATSTRASAPGRAVFERLEAELAEFKAFESGLVFQSGYAANIGTIPALVGPGDVFVRDERSHPSSADGARLSGASDLTFRHRDVSHLEGILRQRRRRRSGVVGKIVVATDGVFGMEGDIAPLADICELAERYGAVVMVDDAHATGVLGRDGRGTVDHFGLSGRVDVHVGTLSKALGAMGGYIGASRELRDRLMRACHPTLYSTLPPPALAAACIAAIGVMRSDTDRIKRLWANTSSFRAKLAAAGFATDGCETPIIRSTSKVPRPRTGLPCGCVNWE